MQRAQDAGILSIDGLEFAEPDRRMQIATKAEATPKEGKRAG